MLPAADDIRYFVETAQTLNISRAAERLGISQPSLSQALQRLEHAVGAPVFLRSKRGVSLTPAGRRLMAQARGLLETWHGMRADAIASMTEVRGSYTVGCHPSVGLNFLPHFLPSLMAEYDALDITIKHDLSRHIAEAVISMKVDLGVVVNPVRHPDLVIHKLCEDDVRMWAASNNRNADTLICDPELLQTQSITKNFAKSGIAFRRTISSSNLETIAALTAAGAGVGILPGQVAARHRGKLKALSASPVSRDMHCLIFRAENKNIRAVQVIAAAIRDVYRRET